MTETASATPSRSRDGSPPRRSARRLAAIVVLALASSAICAADTFSSLSQSPERDGSHDFDFNFGVWHTHIKRITDPLSGAGHSFEMNGTVTVRKVWDGRAQLEEIEADGPNGHWEGLTLFLYNPQAHQWSQSFANSKTGVLVSPLIGEFRNGRGEFISQDTFGDQRILVRGVWSDIKPDSHHFEESYSDDAGKTWSPAFIAELTREKP
jgi:hypothetical protein